jgi:hypothetical protein
MKKMKKIIKKLDNFCLSQIVDYYNNPIILDKPSYFIFLYAQIRKKQIIKLLKEKHY